MFFSYYHFSKKQSISPSGLIFFSVSVWAIYHPSLTQGHMRSYGRSQPVAQWFHKKTHTQKPTDLETESVDSVKMWTLNSLNCCLFMLEYFRIICGGKMYPFNRVHKLAGFMGQATLNKTQFVFPDKISFVKDLDSVIQNTATE